MSDGAPPRPPADRVDAPLYLARHRDRMAERLSGHGDSKFDEADDGAETAEPLYLRRFRARQARTPAPPTPGTAAGPAGPTTEEFAPDT
ncbi:MAG TPA: hypothetical protein VHU17_03815, partial [Acidimicrobiales bacterium]|nr:hypothetical protein [Acidimicrobiales bacterium]